MIVSVAEVRRDLGKESKKYTDSEVEGAIGVATVFADLMIDFFINRKEVNDGSNQECIEKLLRESGKKGDEQKD